MSVFTGSVQRSGAFLFAFFLALLHPLSAGKTPLFPQKCLLPHYFVSCIHLFSIISPSQAILPLSTKLSPQKIQNPLRIPFLAFLCRGACFLSFAYKKSLYFCISFLFSNIIQNINCRLSFHSYHNIYHPKH